MSRIKVPTVLIQLYGIAAPKSLGLRVLDYGPEKDRTESGTFIGHRVSNMFFLAQQLKQEGYVLMDIHQKMRPKLGDEGKMTPVIYLTFQLGGNEVAIDGLTEWLARIFKGDLALDIWLNQPADKPAMLSLNMVKAGLNERALDKFNLYRLVWAEEGSAAV